MFIVFVIPFYKTKFNLFFCIIVNLTLQHIKYCNKNLFRQYFYNKKLMKFRPPQKESTKVEEEAAEMEDKVSEAEEDSADQKAKSKPKEVYRT